MFWNLCLISIINKICVGRKLCMGTDNEGNIIPKSTEDKKDNNPYHLFDNAFLSICAWNKRLLIPLVNEVFGKNIAEDAKLEHMANEQVRHIKDENEEHLIKRITDALVCVGSKRYHFEET